MTIIGGVLCWRDKEIGVIAVACTEFALLSVVDAHSVMKSLGRSGVYSGEAREESGGQTGLVSCSMI